jgi:fatty acid desaturase
MLSDHEQQALRDIRDRLSAEDPAFTRSFGALDDVAPRRSADTTVLVTVAVALLLAVPMLLAGSWVGALVVVALPRLMLLVWRHAHAAQAEEQPGTGRRS